MIGLGGHVRRNDVVEHGPDVFQRIHAVEHRILGRVVAQVSDDFQAGPVALVDHLASHGSRCADVDLQSGHLPLHHIIDKRTHLRRIGQSVSNIAMQRWVGVDQRTGQKHARTQLRAKFGGAGDDGLSDNLVPRVAHAGHSVGQEHRQELVSRHMRPIGQMHQVHVRVDQVPAAGTCLGNRRPEHRAVPRHPAR